MENLFLKDPSLLDVRGYVNGQWIESEDCFAVNNPSTGAVVARVADLSAVHARLAIDAAYAAGPNWAAQTGKERSAILRHWFDLILSNADDLARILTAEMGKPLVEAHGEILYGASFIEWFAEEAKRIDGDVIPGHQRDKRILVMKQPVGVVGSITPWNFPNAMIARKVAPALAAGCTFVARPSELTPLSALAMAVLAERAGIPAGVFNVIPSTDASGVGKELCANPKVRKMTFTGSTRVGKILMEQCAETVKKISLELGGNAPFVVFDDADLEAAVTGAIAAKFRNNGQTCICANRFYVQKPIYDAFVEKLAIKVGELKVGDGFEDGVSLGPLINDAAVSKVEAHISDAVAHGGVVVIGGGRSNLGGTFFRPTVVRDATQKMLVCREESFGPLASIVPFENEREVIEMANDSEFGLAAYFYSQDISRIWRTAEALESGMVGVNTGLISTELMPFGGVKQSGLGREGSKYGIGDFLDIKSICFGNIR
ncbi:NAD-dependent succinate-semialdehyde dehydrogenase [Celeribacter marinus]|uniref:NAD-dependent succinate-semialdehyde dehydrogenase n=1 Tax=Celeribacter marinus TaxID=1397108 RepID=UPI003F6D64F0